jgi:hypothetical protein
VRRGCCRRPRWILCILCGSFVSAAACSAADVRTWAFEATIIHKDDPQMLLGDVRLGDPVRGTFSYDLSSPLGLGSDSQTAFYDYPIWFQGVRLAIENPRTGEELRWGRQAADYRAYTVAVYKDSPFYEPGTSAVAFGPETEDPRPGVSGSVYMDFAGPNVLSNVTLPTAYDLDDWPHAVIYLDASNSTNLALAQIHTITPITPGDFTLDGKINAADYSLWRSTFGPTGVSEADWDRNGSVDAADYVVWRKNAGAASVSNPVATVPEPASAPLVLVLMSFAIAAGGFRPRRR